MTVYLVSQRGTIHKAIQAENGERMTFEGDNLDVAELEVFGQLSLVPATQIKRWCKRCFPEVKR